MRSCQIQRRHSLTPALSYALKWSIEIVEWAPVKPWPYRFFESDAYPSVWTDACGVAPVGGCGLLLALPSSSGAWRFYAASFVWPQRLLAAFSRRKSQWIAIYELGAALAARWVFAKFLQSRR